MHHDFVVDDRSLWNLDISVTYFPSLVAKVVNTLNSKFGGTSSCDVYDEIKADYNCSQLIAGVVSICANL